MMRSRVSMTTATACLLIAFTVAVISGGMFTMSQTQTHREPTTHEQEQSLPTSERLDKATFGAGCFWCTEAVFQQVKGVDTVVSGYSGGDAKNPTYDQVCAGTTGHAEAIQLSFDPEVISYAELLEIFWKTHDPTTRDRQGNDVGTQYRSVIFYHNDEQKKLAKHYQQELAASGAFEAPIVTEIVPFQEFHPAETYHQNYFQANPSQPYCSLVIRPKLEKFKKVFKEKLRAAPSR